MREQTVTPPPSGVEFPADSDRWTPALAGITFFSGITIVWGFLALLPVPGMFEGLDLAQWTMSIMAYAIGILLVLTGIGMYRRSRLAVCALPTGLLGLVRLILDGALLFAPAIRAGDASIDGIDAHSALMRQVWVNTVPSLPHTILMVLLLVWYARHRVRDDSTAGSA